MLKAKKVVAVLLAVIVGFGSALTASAKTATIELSESVTILENLEFKPVVYLDPNSSSHMYVDAAGVGTGKYFAFEFKFDRYTFDPDYAYNADLVTYVILAGTVAPYAMGVQFKGGGESSKYVIYDVKSSSDHISHGIDVVYKTEWLTELDYIDTMIVQVAFPTAIDFPKASTFKLYTSRYLELEVLNTAEQVGSQIEESTSRVESKLEEVSASVREEIASSGEKLENKIDESTDEIGNKIDESTEEIKDALDQQQQNEKDEANKQGNQSVDDVANAIPDYSAGFIDGISSLVSVMSYDGTQCSWSFPQLSLPEIPGVMEEVALTEDDQEIDFQMWIESMPPDVLEIVQLICTIALVVFCFKELYGTIEYALTLKRGGDGSE